MKRIKILLTGVGGQGTLLVSRLIGEAALMEGVPVSLSEIHGMAQRGGVVESTVMLGGIEGPIISEGEADILAGFEPLETFRALKYCSTETVIITNTAQTPPLTVKIGMEAYPDTQTWFDFMKRTFPTIYACDAHELALKAGSAQAANMVLLGILMGAGLMPISSSCMMKNIKTKTKLCLAAINIKAFEMGMEIASS